MSQLAAQLDRLFQQIDAGARMENIMRGDEVKAGRRVVIPGDEPWLPAEDWHQTNVVSVDGLTVRLIAISALKPGHGAFRRLIAAIQAAGLSPCIVEPSREMRETLKRWGWKGRRYGFGFESEERWKPRLQR